jgi:hypothetical protein
MTCGISQLDEHHWEARRQLAQAVSEWSQAATTRHSYCPMLSLVDYEAAHAA